MHHALHPAFQYRKTRDDDCCRFIVFINPLEWKVIPKMEFMWVYKC